MAEDQRGTVLVVEDDPGIARLERQALERRGYRVLTAPDPEEALRLIEQGGVELLVLDYRLPGDRTGLDFYRQLQEAGHDLPVILVTGFSDEATVVQALRAGVRDFVAKSVHYLDYLPEAAERVLRQVRTESQLAESQARVAHLVSSAMDAILAVDGSRHITLFNAAAEEMFRCPAAAAVGQPLDRFLPHALGPEGESRASVRLETMGVRADGETFPLEASVSRAEMAGRPWVTIIARDVTQRKRLEGRLAAQHAITEVLAGSVTHEEAAPRILQTVCAYLGWDQGVVWRIHPAAGVLRCLEIWPPEAASEWEQDLRQAAYPAGTALPGQVWASGEPRWVADLAGDNHHPRWRLAARAGFRSALALPIRLGREVLGVLEFFSREVKPPDPEAWPLLANLGSQVGQFIERKRAEEALKDSEALYRSLVENLPLTIFRKDLEGRIVFGNQRFCQALGRPLEQLVGKTMFDFKPREDVERYAREDQRVIQTGEILETMAEGRRPDGARSFFQEFLKAPVYDARGKVVGVQSILWDITESKHAEQELRRMTSESQVARLIQQKLYPVAAPLAVSFDIGGGSYPAQATGGDYFDFFPLLDQSIGIVVGDVSGHGFGPALLMAETRAYLRALAQTETDLTKILTLTNRVLLQDTGGEYFVTLFFGRLDPQARTFHYASAGHPTGYQMDAAGAVKAELPSTGPPLGLLENATYPCGPPVLLEPGDLLLCLTDGILEAADPEDNPFEAERALDLVRLYRTDPARQIVANLYHGVRAFSQTQPQADDITAAIVKAESAPVEPLGKRTTP